jgi:hypothetical protein
VALDGDVVLSGTGLAWGAGLVPRPADDVAAVGDLVRDLLGSGSSSAPLVMAALRAADPDPELRPSALDLLAALRRCGRPEALLDALWPDPGYADPLPAHLLPMTDLPHDVVPSVAEVRSREANPAVLRPRPAGSPARPTRWRGRRTTLGRPMVVALVVSSVAASAVVLAAVRPASSPVVERLEAAAPTAVAIPSSAVANSSTMPSRSPAEQPRTSASPSASPSTTVPTAAVGQWVTTLAEVDRGRQAALGTGSVESLRRWVDPASPAWADDAALARRVARAHARIDGGDLLVEEVRVGDVDDTRAVLQVRDVRRAYVVVTPGGRSSVPERAARWWTITLRAYGTGWRLAQVESGEEPVSLSTRRVPR